VTIGQQGLTPTVIQAIDLALNAHGLVKLRVFSDDRAERETLLGEIAEGLGCAPVQHIGKLLILWRPLPEPEPEPAARPAKRKAAKEPPAPRRRRRAG
jgi:RNA-binding protein YhbY